MYDKAYFEEYALNTLRDIILPFEEFVHKDSPDIQDIKNSIGVEVTIAVEKTIAESENYGIQRLGKTVSKEEIYKFFGEFYLDGSGKVLAESPTRGAYTVDSYKLLKNAVEAKEGKIDTYRQSFSTVGLYVFVPNSWPDEFDIEIMKNELLHKYDFLIANIGDTVFVASRIDDIPNSTIKISREQMNDYKQKTKNAVSSLKIGTSKR